MKQTFLITFVLTMFIVQSIFAQEKDYEHFNFIQIGDITVYGKSVDNQTRCVHWYSKLDIIAIKFKCCDKYYPCFSCHEEEADHQHKVWPKSEFDQNAILCGVCGNELSIKDYMASENTCPHCKSSFNPGCSNHYHLYFETKESEKEEID
ncbi:CHY zinc finger protein [Shivajiella indica]|uniref:CHY zinc finger protein n=1 Tax=Shivajiella indica TaxID=872115 RepID=A0ABW5B630_9BACT